MFSSCDFPEREYEERRRPEIPSALVFAVVAAMVTIRADVESSLSNVFYPPSADTAPASPPIETRQSFQFQGSGPSENLPQHLERFHQNRTFSNPLFEENARWNDFVIQIAQEASSYRYEYAMETPAESEARYSLKVFSGEQEIATLENFNSVANTVDVHVYLGVHMRVRDISFENVPKLLAELEQARKRCSRPFGKIKKMTKIALRIAGCLGGITNVLSKYGPVETTEP